MIKIVYIILLITCSIPLWSQNIDEDSIKVKTYAKIEQLDSLLQSSPNATSTVGCGKFGSHWDYHLDTFLVSSGGTVFIEDHLLTYENYNDLDAQMIYFKYSVDNLYTLERFFNLTEGVYTIEQGSLKSIKKETRKKILKQLRKYDFKQ